MLWDTYPRVERGEYTFRGRMGSCGFTSYFLWHKSGKERMVEQQNKPHDGQEQLLARNINNKNRCRFFLFESSGLTMEMQGRSS